MTEKFNVCTVVSNILDSSAVCTRESNRESPIFRAHLPVAVNMSETALLSAMADAASLQNPLRVLQQVLVNQPWDANLSAGLTPRFPRLSHPRRKRRLKFPPRPRHHARHPRPSVPETFR